MKHITKSVLKAFLIVALLTGSSVVLTSAGPKAVSVVGTSGVTYNQVYEYLVARGYTVISLCPSTTAKYDWVAHTVKNQVHYNTTVFCDATSIVGNQDVSL